ncbi:ABC transporter permease [Chitinophaga pollutisoli]|uniref:ABC transporter permease n=1 Tax=Chitinophaga pollutisoli TaxID=3133966 RepID=A0ABZ2YMC0_9BACT
MRTIFFILQKEFLQIFRNKSMLPIIFVVPVVQLLVLAFATNYEIRDLSIDIVDHDGGNWSQQLKGKILSSGYFRLHAQTTSDQAFDDLASNKADLILAIPQHFERDLVRNGDAAVQLLVNAINGSKAGLAAGYAQSIIGDFNRRIRLEWMAMDEDDAPSHFDMCFRYWFNPGLNYKWFMVPGILVILVTLIGAFLSGMNIVKEKEAGTIEQLNVTPIRKYQFIIGKLLPFWIIALFELAFGLTVGKLVFDLPFAGNLGWIFLFAAVYLMVMLGLGLLISTFTETQQQAMFITWFFLIICILMSGLFTPIESMPEWAQRITQFNPVAYFVKVMRMVMLKGSGWADIKVYLGIMLLFAVAVNAVAIWNYRKTV